MKLCLSFLKYLFASLLISVAIAWILAAFVSTWPDANPSRNTYYETITAPDGRRWAIELSVFRSMGSTRLLLKCVNARAELGQSSLSLADISPLELSMINKELSTARTQRAAFYACHIEARGWPWKCMSNRYEWTERGVSWHTSPLLGGIEIPIHAPFANYSQSTNPVIPLFPLWLGLFGDTVVVSFALFVAARIVHGIRSLRSDVGRCRVCRYDLRGCVTKICPECGTPFDI